MNAAIAVNPGERRVRITQPRPVDGPEFIRAMAQSRSLHYPWVTAPATEQAWQHYLDRLKRDNEAGFLVRRFGDDALCGVVNLNIITYEALCSAYLSYYAVAARAGKGYMAEGLQLVIDHAFGELGLHRLEANIQPGNEPSRRLVERLGFHHEGFSPRLLKINGEWRDHERWALLAD